MKTIQIDESLYVVVPREPTKEMIAAGVSQQYGDDPGIAKCFQAMLAAAPEQPQGDAARLEEIRKVAASWNTQDHSDDKNALLPASAAAPATAPDEAKAKDQEVIRAAGVDTAKPAVSSEVDLRERAVAYLALAEKATAGPWAHTRVGYQNDVVSLPTETDRSRQHLDWQFRLVGPNSDRNAAFIAASHEAAAIIRAFLNETKP